MNVEEMNAERIRFFDRPGQLVAPDLAAHWYTHIPTKEKVKPTLHDGQAKILGLETTVGMQAFDIQEAVIFTADETMSRFGGSRGREIGALEAGEIICYNSRGIILTFVKTQGPENIMISSLRRVDHQGNPLYGDEAEVSASKVAVLAQLHHKATGQLSPFEFQGRQAFLLTIAGHKYDDNELQRLYEELLKPPAAKVS